MCGAADWEGGGEADVFGWTVGRVSWCGEEEKSDLDHGRERTEASDERERETCDLRVFAVLLPFGNASDAYQWP